MRLNVAYWHKWLVAGLYGNFRHGPRFENRQTGLTLCSYGNGDGKVTLGELQAYLDDEMTYQARRRWSRGINHDLRHELRLIRAPASKAFRHALHRTPRVHPRRR